MRQLSQFKFIPRSDANEIVLRAMQPSIRFTRDQCFDLPPTTYSTRQVESTPAAARAYKDMCDELSLQIKTHQVTAANEGVKLSKLIQIACGFVYDSAGKAHYIGGVTRLKEIFAVIEESGGKCIVFGPFRYFVEVLNLALKHRYSTAMVHGETPKGERDRIFAEFQKGSLRVIAAHPKTMAHGLTLTAAATIIWAAPITSLEIYEQANARITRPGQTQNTSIVHVQSTKAEQHIYSRLRRKAKTQGILLEMFEHE
jgi:SNF2 family DNA or RNA helicase